MSKRNTSVVVVEPERIAISKEDVVQFNLRIKKANTKLENFTKAKEDYENAGFFGKFFKKGELRKAQLNAIEGNAEMTRIICSLVQALADANDVQIEQQHSIKDKQEQLHAQGDQIREIMAQIQESQSRVEKVNTGLENAINDLYEIRGITNEEAKKLIGVRKKVEKVEEKLQADFKSLNDNFESNFTELSKNVTNKLQSDDEKLVLLKSEFSENLTLLSKSNFRTCLYFTVFNVILAFVLKYAL